MTTIQKNITAEKLKHLLDKKEQLELVDVRSFDEFKQLRIPHTHLIPTSELPLRVDEINTNKTIYIICRSGQRSKQTCQTLQNLGVTAAYLEGGLNAWQKAGYPVIEGTTKNIISIDRQTRITIGILVLLGLLIPKFLWWLPWFVSIMLIIAGITNTCLMMNFLAAAPWNKERN